MVLVPQTPLSSATHSDLLPDMGLMTDEDAYQAGFMPTPTEDEWRGCHGRPSKPGMVGRACRRLERTISRRLARPPAAPRPGAVPRARSRRTRAASRPATVTASSSDPGGDGDPDAVSPELGRFLDWLADEAVKEMIRR